MCKTLALCFLGIGTVCSSDGDRIVGGSEAELGQYSHQMSLRLSVGTWSSMWS